MEFCCDCPCLDDRHGPSAHAGACSRQPGQTRQSRAEASIARGEVDVAGVIEESPWETESMTLAELLTSQRRWGRTRARKFLQAPGAEREQEAGDADVPSALASRPAPCWRNRARATRSSPEPPLTAEAADFEGEAARGPTEGGPQRQKGGDEGDDPDRQRDRQDEAAEVEKAAGDDHEHRSREQRRVGAVAGEVLAGRDLEAAERAEDDAEPERGRVAADQPDRRAGRSRRGSSARRGGICPTAPAGAHPSGLAFSLNGRKPSG